MKTPNQSSLLVRIGLVALVPALAMVACDTDDDIIAVDEALTMRQAAVGVQFEEEIQHDEVEEYEVLISTPTPCEGSTLDIACGGPFEADETCVIVSKGSACALFTCNEGEAYLCHAEVLDGTSTCSYDGDLNDCKRRQ
ncbi:MAG: hypothetical protein AAF799_32565 [Myxococcota bacterium]